MWAWACTCSVFRWDAKPEAASLSCCRDLLVLAEGRPSPTSPWLPSGLISTAMWTLMRLRPYLRHEWRTVAAGLFFMVVNSLLSGFSIALTLPIIEKVFLRKDAASPGDLHVPEGLQRTWAGVRDA